MSCVLYMYVKNFMLYILTKTINSLHSLDLYITPNYLINQDKLFLTSWHIFHFMTNIWHIFDVMTNLLMRWQTFWRDDVLLTSWRTFWSNDEPLKSWRVYDIITNLWRLNKHNVSTIFDVMVNVLALWKFVMTWHTIWCHDIFFDVMTNFLTSWCVPYFKANVVLSWRIPWPAYIVLTFFFIILGTKYYENLFLM